MALNLWTPLTEGVVIYKVVSGMFCANINDMYAKVAANRQPLRMGDMTEEELLAYNGSNPKIPLLIAIKRQIYDVSSFSRHDRYVTPKLLISSLPNDVHFELTDARTCCMASNRRGLSAVVIFSITICSYAFERCEKEEISMVALSGCIWLQAFVVALDTNSFTVLQHLAIWGNLLTFYMINLSVNALPSSDMYTIMFRLCQQPTYWSTIILIVAVGIGPLVALKYFRYTFAPTEINILQQAERLGSPASSWESIEVPVDKDVSPLSNPQAKNRNHPVYEPLLSSS
nr:Phospholipid-transporting ATPase 2 [Ipomoea batatas]